MANSLTKDMTNKHMSQNSNPFFLNTKFMQFIFICTQSLSHVQLFVTHGLQPSRLPCPWGFSRLEYWSGLPCPPPGDLPSPGIEARSLALQADSLPGEPPGKPRKTGMGSLSLLQSIFLTQESNQRLLHCRWILYQLNSQGTPYFLIPPSICVSKIIDSVNRFKSSKKGNPCAIRNRLEMKLLLHS